MNNKITMSEWQQALEDSGGLPYSPPPKGAKTAEQLSKEFGLTKSGAKDRLLRMVRMGLVKRTRHLVHQNWTYFYTLNKS